MFPMVNRLSMDLGGFAGAEPFLPPFATNRITDRPLDCTLTGMLVASSPVSLYRALTNRTVGRGVSKVPPNATGSRTDLRVGWRISQNDRPMRFGRFINCENGAGFFFGIQENMVWQEKEPSILRNST